MNKEAVKSWLQKAGLYGRVRRCYRRINPRIQKEIRLERQLYSQLVASNDLCFDIGANVGQTIEVLLGCADRIVAVEPNVMCLPVLREQFGSNDRVTLLNNAVGAEPGTLKLHFSGTASTASVREDWPFANQDTQEVETTTLDRLVDQYGVPKLCKVDVEGFELEVFKGLSRPLPVICFEIHGKETDLAFSCLDRLASIGTIDETNMTDLSNVRWLFNEWIGVDALKNHLSANFTAEANIVVKMKV